MPTAKQHESKADSNATFATSLSLNSEPNIEWALTAIFYAAVHYVEAYMDKVHSTHCKTHTVRDGWVARDSGLKPIYSEYQDLKFYSLNARYEVTKFASKDVTVEALPTYETIKARIKRFL